jgi:hypothetical protein
MRYFRRFLTPGVVDSVVRRPSPFKTCNRDTPGHGHQPFSAFESQGAVPLGLDQLQTQSSRQLNLWQDCHDIGEKGSEIVPLGAPLLLGLTHGPH